MLKIIAFVILVALIGPKSAADPMLLDGQSGKIALDRVITFTEDADHSLSINNIINEQISWEQNNEATFNKGYDHSTWWLKLEITNSNESYIKQLIEISYAVIDHLDVYIVSDKKVLKHYAMGDKNEFSRRIYNHRFFIVPIEWQPQQALTIYLQVKSSSAIQVPITLWDEKYFSGFDSSRTMLFGMFFGTMIAVAVFNFLIFLALRESLYLLYVGYVGCMAIFLGSLDGYTYRYLWPTFTEWNDKAIIVFLSGVVVFGSAFTRVFLKLRFYNNFIDKSFVVAIGGGFLLAASSFTLPYQYTITALIFWAVTICLLGLIAGFYCWYKGQNTAKYYIIAWTSILLGGLVLALSKVNILPSNIFTDNSTHIGAALEVILLSFALAERINGERKLRYEAQKDMLLNTKKLNESLENRVLERTEKLEVLTKKLRDLSNTDQLTGLCNRRQLEDTLQREWDRAKRYRHSVAVILLDIDLFKGVNDNYGHLVGDDCIKEVANRIQGGLRWPTDLAARYGGEEFCVLLPESDLHGAATVAERIRKKIQEDIIVASSGCSLSVTISAGIYACVPTVGTDLRILIKEADSALYKAKELGRNRVYFEVQDQSLNSKKNK